MPVAPLVRPAAGAVRHFGRFQLMRLLGKSSRTMLWLASDPRHGQEVMLALPRRQLRDEDAVARQIAHLRKVARIDHPGLATIAEVADHDRWVYVTYARGESTTLAERMGGRGFKGEDLVAWLLQGLQGLAYAHEAGVMHNDLQPQLLLLTEPRSCCLMGLGVAELDPKQTATAQGQRAAIERDVLAFGLVMHHGLVGQPALGVADAALLVDQLAPWGTDHVRLPWDDVLNIPEPLRVIANRATDRLPLQRYRNARSLARALDGWVNSTGDNSIGPLGLLVDKIRSAGLLPAMPGGAARAARLQQLENERTDELAEHVLQDVGLSFELLRLVNSAAVRGSLGAGNGPILTIRRAIALLGLDGVRRAANSLRRWPGTLNEAHAADFSRQLDLARQAGRLARWVRPAGYDGELVTLMAMLQRLGRLVTQYHFPEEAAQIRRLMRSSPSLRATEPGEPGMSERAASYAVLGVDIDLLGTALGHRWGLDETALMMMRRVPPDALVHDTDRDVDLLRFSASCANEIIDARGLPSQDHLQALQRVVQRYGTVLQLSFADLQKAFLGELDDDRQADSPVMATGVPPSAMQRPVGGVAA